MSDRTAAAEGPPIRDAATVIVLRDRDTRPRVLMGQRGAKAAFMPNKFVFPGGAVDAGDRAVPLATPLTPVCTARLEDDAPAGIAHSLAVAAIRELWEETGQLLGRRAPWPDTVPTDWLPFAGAGLRPSAEHLQFVFRAITPPGLPRRFDARFFLLDAEALVSDPDDFSEAEDELAHLQWIEVDRVRDFDLPFITEVVLAEVAARARDEAPPESVPFFHNDAEESLFLRLHGRPMRED
ncbi:NUDIX hydrolase [Ponticoccus litoralis]|uniref:DNA mismatch repair protein MutT n=1 Tax=Ponticoccus litoralis TaxID=422297 RepID=A0AAW9SFL3_9RHOB